MEGPIKRHGHLLEIARKRRFRKNSYICIQGDSPKELYIVASGTVKILIDGHIIHFACEDDMFGTFVSGSNCEHSAVALNEVVVYAIGQKKLSRYTNESLELQAELLSRAGKIIKALSKHMSSLKKGVEGEVKLARFLLSVKDRQKIAKYELIEFILPMSRVDIANYLGLATETVARIFTRFVKMGLISLSGKGGRKVLIRNIPALQKLANLQ